MAVPPEASRAAQRVKWRASDGVSTRKMSSTWSPPQTSHSSQVASGRVPSCDPTKAALIAPAETPVTMEKRRPGRLRARPRSTPVW